MNRKLFFKGLALGTLSLPFLLRSGATSRAQGPSVSKHRNHRFSWKMVTTWPPGFPVIGEGCLLFSKWVKEMSDGDLEIKVYGGGELVPPLEVFDAVSSGVAEMGSGAAYYWAGKIPSAPFFASVPFGMNAQQVNSWLYSGGGLDKWRAIYEPHGVIPFPGGNTGVQMGGWFKRKINSVDDLRGLKMRIPGLGGKVMERVGVIPVLLAGSEIYTGLERGVIDAAEWIGPFNDYRMGFQQIAPYYYAPGWHETGSVLEVLVNQKAFHSLPSDLKMVVETAAARLNSWMLSEFDYQNAIYLKKIKEEGKTEVLRFSDDVLSLLKATSKEVLVQLAENDQQSASILSAYESYHKSISGWSDLSEKLVFTALGG